MINNLEILSFIKPKGCLKIDISLAFFVYFSIFTKAVFELFPFASFEVGISFVRTLIFPFRQIVPIFPLSRGSYQAPSSTLTTPLLISSVITAPANISPRLL